MTKAGPEVGVAATKTFLTQIYALYLLALRLAETRSSVLEDELRKLGRELRRVPENLEETLDLLKG